MHFKRFRLIAVARVIFIVTIAFLFLYSLPHPDFFVVKILLGGLIVYQVYGLIHFVEKTNRDLNRFFESISNDDFTQTFSSEKVGDSFDSLRKSFSRVTKQFLELRSEKEEQFRYLQTIIRHVGTGLISYTTNGDVELINQAAKKLLAINNLKNIKDLEPLSDKIVDKLLNLKAGESTSLKIETGEQTLYLSINAIQFKLKDMLYTLISLQDIQSEIEREHLAKELEIAWNVQKSLLPGSDPQVPGFDIAGMCQPAEEVGGDYYDFIPLGENCVAMIIGDVSGKGIPASFYMTLTKGFIQSHMRENTSPKEVLLKVNRLMLETIDKKSFVTVLIAVLDRENKKVVIARAGHNPAIYLPSKEERARLIKPGGIALGITGNASFEKTVMEYEIELDKNDWLILHTDGFTEAMNENSEEFGEERLMESICENRDKNAARMIDALFERVLNFSNSSTRHDDMTMIAIKVAPAK